MRHRSRTLTASAALILAALGPPGGPQARAGFDLGLGANFPLVSGSTLTAPTPTSAAPDPSTITLAVAGAILAVAGAILGVRAARRRQDLAGWRDILRDVLIEEVKPPEGGWVAGLTLTQARDLLDWLENHGCTGLEVSHQEETGFAVRCVCPPGSRRAASARPVPVQGVFLDPNGGAISVTNANVLGRVFGGDGHHFQLISGSTLPAPMPTSAAPEPSTMAPDACADGPR